MTGLWIGRNSAGDNYIIPPGDLTMHGVVIGMTGSGKTGMGIALIEEAVTNGAGAIVIDPKGDLGALALLFDEARADEIAPWLEDGVTPDEVAEVIAEGRREWSIDRESVAWLRRSADWRVLTPGGRFARPVNLIGELVPDGALDPDARAEYISNQVGALLQLAGVDSRDGRAPEHVWLSLVVDAAQKNGRRATLELLREVLTTHDLPEWLDSAMTPSEAERLLPKKDRVKLARALDAIALAPQFQAWRSGPKLDVRDLVYDLASKRPRVTVISLAHLDDEQRQFFMAIMLGRIVAWMRHLPGATGQLRHLLYIDEAYGLCPPVANPPTKRPLLTLIKQARAFGLGVVLATQNPTDLDYKALAVGTWVIGRLQTEQDRAWVSDGIASVTGSSASDVAQEIAQLRKREFLVRTPSLARAQRVRSRQTMALVRGPLTRGDVKRLADMLDARSRNWERDERRRIAEALV